MNDQRNAQVLPQPTRRMAHLGFTSFADLGFAIVLLPAAANLVLRLAVALTLPDVTNQAQAWRDVAGYFLSIGAIVAAVGGLCWSVNASTLVRRISSTAICVGSFLLLCYVACRIAAVYAPDIAPDIILASPLPALPI